jgi:hypothetical protein
MPVWILYYLLYFPWTLIIAKHKTIDLGVSSQMLEVAKWSKNKLNNKYIFTTYFMQLHTCHDVDGYFNILWIAWKRCEITHQPFFFFKFAIAALKDYQKCTSFKTELSLSVSVGQMSDIILRTTPSVF